MAAAGSCGHRKTTAKNWENISHLVRGQTRPGVFDVPELIVSVYFVPKPFISVKITVKEKPRPHFISYASLIGLVNYIQG